MIEPNSTNFKLTLFYLSLHMTFLSLHVFARLYMSSHVDKICLCSRRAFIFMFLCVVYWSQASGPEPHTHQAKRQSAAVERTLATCSNRRFLMSETHHLQPGTSFTKSVGRLFWLDRWYDVLLRDSIEWFVVSDVSFKLRNYAARTAFCGAAIVATCKLVRCHLILGWGQKPSACARHILSSFWPSTDFSH